MSEGSAEPTEYDEPFPDAEEFEESEEVAGDDTIYVPDDGLPEPPVTDAQDSEELPEEASDDSNG